MVAFEDFAGPPGGYRPNCCPQLMVPVLVRSAADFERLRPIGDLVDHQVHRADMPVGARLAEVAHLLG